MAKNKLVIWGGNRKELILENMDSHASVSAYFLTKYLSKYYDIVNLVDMDKPEQLLDHLDAKAILSTFQYGFTTRIILKDKCGLFTKIKRDFKGKLCSVTDKVSNKRYYEDILFTVLPTSVFKNKLISKKCFNKNILITRMGWCADPQMCLPEPVPEDEINVFVDHPPYSSNAADATSVYFKAFKKILNENHNLKLNVYQQNNQGVVKWDFSSDLNKEGYTRSNKVPWKEMIEYYKKTHIFCSTHRESAGLAAAEAAMCGAKIYIPFCKISTTFMSKRLTKDNISFRTFRYNPVFGDSSSGIIRAFKKDMRDGFNREGIHQRFSKTNSWEVAADRIHSVLSQYSSSREEE